MKVDSAFQRGGPREILVLILWAMLAPVVAHAANTQSGENKPIEPPPGKAFLERVYAEGDRQSSLALVSLVL
ncbi:hypothetical protein [Roseateles sp.]|uniref:hypothetical protein n=1 Tax=Roseateles sp. TaxID=1971397 RepID=UPI00286CCD1F|nr:hypothetical protein [Roseateles sp.]